MAGKLIIFSAPSGSGKSTIINFLLKQNLRRKQKPLMRMFLRKKAW